MFTSSVKSANKSTHHSWRALVFTLVALIFCAPYPAQALTKTWDAGSTTGDWNLGNNWATNGVPGSADDVLFDNSDLSSQPTLEDVFLNAGQSINGVTLNLTTASNQNWHLGASGGSSAFTLTLATGNISVLSTSGTGTYVIGATTGTGIGTGLTTLATSGGGFTFNNSRTNGGLLQINAIVSGSSTVTKTGAGTVSLTGVNTYTGGTTINGGTVIANNVASLGATSGALTLNAGTLEIATGFSTTRNITLGNSASTFQIDPSQTYTNTGVISSTGALNKTGSGTMVLNGANTYTGATIVSAGTLNAGTTSIANTSGAFGNNSAVTLANTAGVTLNITGFNTQIGSLTGGGAAGGNVALGAATLTTGGNNTSPAAYAGVISGTGGVTKIGTGTQILSGTNTYAGGTTVNAGTLFINNTSGSGTGSGSVTVNNAGTVLGGNGTMTSAVTVNSGGTLAPGSTANSTAILGTGAVTLQGATLALSVNGTTAGTLYDQLNISGAVTITGSTLALNFGAFTPAATDRFYIVLNDGNDAVTGTFATVTGLPSGFTVVYNANGDAGVSGNDISLEPVPEPATWCTAALAAVAIAFHSRHRLRALRQNFIARLTSHYSAISGSAKPRQLT
jgi:autotransporter-associated beta strand protein